MYTFKSFIYILCTKIIQQFRRGMVSLWVKTYIVVIISVSYNFNNLQWYICIEINEVYKWQKRVWTNYWERVKYCPQYNWSRWLGITNCSLNVTINTFTDVWNNNSFIFMYSIYLAEIFPQLWVPEKEEKERERALCAGTPSSDQHLWEHSRAQVAE